jgi:hypothetical protein
VKPVSLTVKSQKILIVNSIYMTQIRRYFDELIINWQVDEWLYIKDGHWNVLTHGRLK